MTSVSTALSPARPSATATVTSRPLGLSAARITGGFWAPRQQANAAQAIRSGLERLEAAGNLQNLRIAAGLAVGEAIGPIFSDSDVYKWLESVAWEYGRSPDPELLKMQRDVTSIIAAAQTDDGYIDSVVQVRYGLEGRYQELPWSHEHYCAGHLIQAAVAQVRCTGDSELLAVAIKVADHLVATFGDDKRHDVDGHPVIEMALVELFRETQNRAYLELARYFVDARGYGLMEKYGKEPTYFSDRVPVRKATTVEGHAVRAVYLTAGAADVAAELGDSELLDALAGQFSHMWATKTYLTGGLGSRWEGEAFGDEYELPTDRGYAETCAAIGGIQWAWRMLLATGEAHYGDAIERMLYNGFLAGVSLAGTEYFYVNPLQLRSGAHPDGNRTPAHGRRGWFDCACCPPNIMRTLASLDGYLASTDGSGLQVHQYATGTLESEQLGVTVQTDYPWAGRVLLTLSRTDDQDRRLSLRIPAWAEGAEVKLNGEPHPSVPGSYVHLDRRWTAGETVELILPMEPRLVSGHPRIDAVRGCVAVERGPLVYALEQVDQADGVDLDEVEVSLARPTIGDHQPDLLGGVTLITIAGRTKAAVERPAWPFPTVEQTASADGRDIDLVAIPYYAWANRQIDTMRVWLPKVTD